MSPHPWWHFGADLTDEQTTVLAAWILGVIAACWWAMP